MFSHQEQEINILHTVLEFRDGSDVQNTVFPAVPFCSKYRKLSKVLFSRSSLLFRVQKTEYVCKHDSPDQREFSSVWSYLLCWPIRVNILISNIIFKVCTWEYIYRDRSGWPPAAARYWGTAGIRNGRCDWLSARSWCWLAGRGGSGESARRGRTSHPPRWAAAAI